MLLQWTGRSLHRRHRPISQRRWADSDGVDAASSHHEIDHSAWKSLAGQTIRDTNFHQTLFWWIVLINQCSTNFRYIWVLINLHMFNKLWIFKLGTYLLLWIPLICLTASTRVANFHRGNSSRCNDLTNWRRPNLSYARVCAQGISVILGAASYEFVNFWETRCKPKG